jgi:hypothetical protein
LFGPLEHRHGHRIVGVRGSVNPDDPIYGALFRQVASRVLDLDHRRAERCELRRVGTGERDRQSVTVIRREGEVGRRSLAKHPV